MPVSAAVLQCCSAAVSAECGKNAVIGTRSRAIADEGAHNVSTYSEFNITLSTFIYYLFRFIILGKFWDFLRLST